MEGNYVNRNSTHREGNSFSFEEDSWGNSWPARNYGCSFCKREFRSAQALGGHMNVHRKDRARLRSSLSSLVSQCPKPNPNNTNNKPDNPITLRSLPSSSQSPLLSDEPLNCAHLCCPCGLTLSSASTSGDKKPRLTYSPQLPLLSPQRKDVNYNMRKNTRSDLIGVDEEELKVFKNKNEHNITLELGIGLLKHQEKKLDLELRLGHS